ncbi:hypothetical protein LOD99_4122 [Oopsacas minuta]|uniref:Uncharacterized protein n=1 Tax=Oopsacas minuta TaxID=111878 RepID=A0AAV7JXH2_9METZ|nr:hypothetical protein LOD99_4122 [Oopsacas minuta]
MSEDFERARIIDAKSRITKFTLDNQHLTSMIENLKKEIRKVEASKARLLSGLDPTSVIVEEDRESNIIDTKHMDLNESFLNDSSINLSENSDSISSSLDNDSIRNEFSQDSTPDSNSDFNSDSNADCPTELDNSSFNNDKEFSKGGSAQNLILECSNCVETLLGNLNVIKKCLRTNHCLDCRQLRAGISSLQGTTYNKRHNYNAIELTSKSSSFISIFNFMSMPILFAIICGYFGVLIYAKQANSYLVTTPPQ